MDCVHHKNNQVQLIHLAMEKMNYPTNLYVAYFLVKTKIILLNFDKNKSLPDARPAISILLIIIILYNRILIKSKLTDFLKK